MLRRIAGYVQHGEAPRVGELARDFGTTPRTLLARFSKETGKSLRDYILDERLKRAAHLLLSSPMNIAEIAYACGFNKQGALSENFLRRYGLTPRDYRARNAPKK